MRDIRAVMERWGRWAAYEEDRAAWPSICATFRGVLPVKASSRPSCTDEDGLIIDACVSRLHAAGRDAEREALFTYYVLRLSIRDVADVLGTNKMRVRNLLVAGESFVTGAMAMLGIRLDMDLVLKATGKMKPANGQAVNLVFCNFMTINPAGTIKGLDNRATGLY